MNSELQPPTKEELGKLLSRVLFPKPGKAINLVRTTRPVNPNSPTREAVAKMQAKLPLELQESFKTNQSDIIRYNTPLVSLTNDLVAERQGKILNSLSTFVDAEGFQLPLGIESKLKQHAYDDIIFVLTHVKPSPNDHASVLAHTLLFEDQIMKQSGGHVIAGLHAALQQHQPKDVTYLCGLTLGHIYDTRKFHRVIDYFSPSIPNSNIYYTFTDVDKYAIHVEFLVNLGVSMPEDFMELLISASNFPKVFAIIRRLVNSGKLPFNAQTTFDYMCSKKAFWIRQPNEYATPTLRNYSNILGLVSKYGVDIGSLNSILKQAAQTLQNAHVARHTDHYIRKSLSQIIEQLSGPTPIGNKPNSNVQMSNQRLLSIYQQLLKLQPNL